MSQNIVILLLGTNLGDKKNNLEIEQKMGRIYSQPKENEIYVDRLIDIDILFYNKLLINCNYLKIPHPQIYSREFIKSLSFY